MENKKESVWQATKFLLFSVSAGVVQVAVFSLLELFKLNYWICYLVALVASVIWNFTLNREFTFKSANNVPIAMIKVAIFYAIFTPLSTWGGDVLTNAGWNDFLVLALSMAINLVTEFLYSKYVTFRGSINTNKRALRQAEQKIDKDKNK